MVFVNIMHPTKHIKSEYSEETIGVPRASIGPRLPQPDPAIPEV